MDSANFWGGFGGLAVALGLFPGAVAVAQAPDWSVLLPNPWFKLAIACWAVGLLALVRMAWLRTAHLHAEGHRCPDPEAHTERPRSLVAEPHISTGPSSAVLVPDAPAATPRSPDEGVVSGPFPPQAPSTRPPQIGRAHV